MALVMRQLIIKNRKIFIATLVALTINILWASIWKTEIPVYLLIPVQLVIVLIFTSYAFSVINNKFLCFLICFLFSWLIGFAIVEVFSMMFSEKYFMVISERIERGLFFDYLVLHFQLNQIFGAPALGLYFYLIYFFHIKY